MNSRENSYKNFIRSGHYCATILNPYDLLTNKLHEFLDG